MRFRAGDLLEPATITIDVDRYKPKELIDDLARGEEVVLMMNEQPVAQQPRPAVGSGMESIPRVSAYFDHPTEEEPPIEAPKLKWRHDARVLPGQLGEPIGWRRGVVSYNTGSTRDRFPTSTNACCIAMLRWKRFAMSCPRRSSPPPRSNGV